MGSSPCGFLLVDKPSGLSSHKALSGFKRSLGERRIGHAGTLDPLATGLLVAAVGKATRLLPLAEGRDKEYLVALRLGMRTDTLDTDGQILSTHPTPDPESLDWPALFAPWIGDISQVPPAYSAISVDGVRSYDRARRGEQVELPPRSVRIDRIHREANDLLCAPGCEADVVLRVTCSKGTYVRSLVRDLGEAIGCGATVSALRRTAIGSWHLPDRFTPQPEVPLLPVLDVFPEIPAFALEETHEWAFFHGHATPCPIVFAEQAFVTDGKGTALAFGSIAESTFQPRAMLVTKD